MSWYVLLWKKMILYELSVSSENSTWIHVLVWSQAPVKYRKKLTRASGFRFVYNDICYRGLILCKIDGCVPLTHNGHG